MLMSSWTRIRQMNRLVSGEASSAKGPRDTLRVVGQRPRIGNQCAAASLPRPKDPYPPRGGRRRTATAAALQGKCRYIRTSAPGSSTQLASSEHQAGDRRARSGQPCLADVAGPVLAMTKAICTSAASLDQHSRCCCKRHHARVKNPVRTEVRFSFRACTCGLVPASDVNRLVTGSRS
jgi:hypothetical protein